MERERESSESALSTRLNDDNNSYRYMKWTQRAKFKLSTKLLAFHLMLIILGKAWTHLFSFSYDQTAVSILLVGWLVWEWSWIQIKNLGVFGIMKRILLVQASVKILTDLMAKFEGTYDEAEIYHRKGWVWYDTRSIFKLSTLSLNSGFCFLLDWLPNQD